METPADLNQWRREQRARLLARRTSAPTAERAAWNHAINNLLEPGLPAFRGLVVGFCWPYQGEVDVRPFIQRLRDHGSRAALPAVVGKQQPLEFREWWPNAPMRAGALGIPAPEGTPVLVPDVVLVPPVGFSEEGSRLGYGGGYFDRTLAALSPQPLKIGVAYELSRMPTIHPQPHDLPMDFIVTEAGLHVVEAGRLRRIDAAACAVKVAELIAARGLPRPQA